MPFCLYKDLGAICAAGRDISSMRLPATRWSRLAALMIYITFFFCAPQDGNAQHTRAQTIHRDTDMKQLKSLKTFSVMGKEVEALEPDKEIELLHRVGRGCLTHMWFAMDERVRVRVYVDSEKQPSIDMALDLGHGYAFGGPPEPWGNHKMGRYGAQFNNFHIPYGTQIRVTLLPITRVFDGVNGRKIWWTIRGTENLPLMIGGQRLPENARLHLYRLENYRAKPLEEFTLCTVRGGGQLYLVTLAAHGEHKYGDWRDLGFMEGCVRAYLDDQTKPEFLSSGLEDYFLGSGYFHQNQRYYGEVAGLTHIDKAANTFSAYRFHDDDPVFFQKNLRLTLRCGEELNGKPLHDPQTTQYTAYVWVYQW